jgi:hypothetical protein
MHRPSVRVTLPDKAAEDLFGRDTFCVDSLRTGRFATGVRLVAQNAYHRLTTPRGQLRGGEEEQDYGLDLSEMIGGVASDADALAVQHRVRNELQKDERIGDVTVSVLVVRDAIATEYQITVVAQTAEGPFTLVVRVADVTVELLRLTTEPA